MPLDINRPSDTVGQKPRLSKLGKIIVAVSGAALVILAVVIISVLHANGQTAQAKKELSDQLIGTVERAETVCKNALSAVNANDQAVSSLQKYLDRIEKENDAAKKAEIAQEMINDTLSKVSGNQQQIDELNGARNRILLAVKNYNAKT